MEYFAEFKKNNYTFVSIPFYDPPIIFNRTQVQVHFISIMNLFLIVLYYMLEDLLECP